MHTEIGTCITNSYHIQRQHERQRPLLPQERFEQQEGGNGERSAVGGMGGGETVAAAIVVATVGLRENAQLLDDVGVVGGAQTVEQRLEDAGGDDVGTGHSKEDNQHGTPCPATIKMEHQGDKQQKERRPSVGMRDGPHDTVQPRGIMPIDKQQHIAVHGFYDIGEKKVHPSVSSRQKYKKSPTVCIKKRHGELP